MICQSLWSGALSHFTNANDFWHRPALKEWNHVTSVLSVYCNFMGLLRRPDSMILIPSVEAHVQIRWWIWYSMDQRFYFVIIHWKRMSNRSIIRLLEPTVNTWSIFLTEKCCKWVLLRLIINNNNNNNFPPDCPIFISYLFTPSNLIFPFCMINGHHPQAA